MAAVYRKLRLADLGLLLLCRLTEGETAKHREDLQPSEEGEPRPAA